MYANLTFTLELERMFPILSWLEKILSSLEKEVIGKRARTTNNSKIARSNRQKLQQNNGIISI